MVVGAGLIKKKKTTPSGIHINIKTHDMIPCCKRDVAVLVLPEIRPPFINARLELSGPRAPHCSYIAYVLESARAVIMSRTVSRVTDEACAYVFSSHEVVFCALVSCTAVPVFVVQFMLHA